MSPDSAVTCAWVVLQGQAGGTRIFSMG